MENKSFISFIKHEDGTFSAIEQMYHPTPSDCDRWIDGLEDNRRWDTEEKAIEEFKSEIKKLLENETLNFMTRWRLENLI